MHSQVKHKHMMQPGLRKWGWGWTGKWSLPGVSKWKLHHLMVVSAEQVWLVGNQARPWGWRHRQQVKCQALCSRCGPTASSLRDQVTSLRSSLLAVNQSWCARVMHAQALSHVWPPATLMDCSLPGSSVHGIFQARILEWVAYPFSRVSSWPSRDQTLHCRQILYYGSH